MQGIRKTVITETDIFFILRNFSKSLEVTNKIVQ